jgi:hypothetical protein
MGSNCPNCGNTINFYNKDKEQNNENYSIRKED